MGRAQTLDGPSHVGMPAYQKAYQEKLRQAHKRELANARAREYQKGKGRKAHAVREHLRRVRQRDPEVKRYAILLMGDPCSYCDGSTDSLDHIEPLSRGGDSGWDNFTAACRSCNSTKNAKSLLEFLATRG